MASTLRRAASLAAGRARAARHAARRRASRGVDLRSPEPVSSVFGLDRGRPIDRFYIERFLAAQAEAIRGRVLEAGDDRYTTTFGQGVERSDIIHATADNPAATIVGDLADPATLPEGAFDCLVLTQVLQFVYDAPAAVATCHRALAPGGVLLLTVPGISQVSRYDMDRWGDFWRFTDAAVRRLLSGPFAAEDVEVRAHGNAGAACALLQGLAVEDMGDGVLEADSPDYPVVVTAVARRP